MKVDERLEDLKLEIVPKKEADLVEGVDLRGLAEVEVGQDLKVSNVASWEHR